MHKIRLAAVAFMGLGLAVAQTPSEPQAVLSKPGFYRVEPADAVLGPMVYLYTRTSADRSESWLEGALLPNGEIRSENVGALRKQVWRSKQARDDDRGSLRIKIVSDDRIEITATSRRYTLGKAHVLTRVQDMRRVTSTKYINHRGRCLTFPSLHHGTFACNTIPALEEALDSGYAGFEFDLRVTRDGKFIVSHDESLKVATSCTGKVSEHTLEELKRCQVLKSTVLPELTARLAPNSAPMPSLDDVFDRFLTDPRQPILQLDVKPNTDATLDGALRPSLERAITQLGSREFLKRLTVYSRSDVWAGGLIRDYPEMTVLLEGSTGAEPLLDYPTYIPEMSGRPRSGHNGISLNLGLTMAMPNRSELISRLLQNASAHIYPVVGWNVNGEGALARVQEEYPTLEVLLSDEPFEEIARLQMAKTLGRNSIIAQAMTGAPGQPLGPRVRVGIAAESTRARESMLIEFHYDGVDPNDIPLPLRFVEISGEFEPRASGIPYANIRINPITAGLNFGPSWVEVAALPIDFQRELSAGLNSSVGARVVAISIGTGKGFAQFALSFLGVEFAQVGLPGAATHREVGMEWIKGQLLFGKSFEYGPMEFRFDFAGASFQVGQVTRRLDLWQEFSLGLRSRLVRGNIFVRYGYRLIDVSGSGVSTRRDGYLRAGMRIFF